MAGAEATMEKRKWLCKIALKMLAKLIKRINGKIMRENSMVHAKRVGVSLSFGSAKLIMGSAQISKQAMSGSRIRATKAKDVITKEAWRSCEAFFASARMGTKEELKAPSARIRLKKDGSLMAMSKASVSALTPKNCETRRSRMYPRTRLTDVKKPTQKVCLKNWNCEDFIPDLS